MSEERSEQRADPVWPPFRPNLRLLTDLEKGRSKKEWEAILRRAKESRRFRAGDARPAPEKTT